MFYFSFSNHASCFLFCFVVSFFVVFFNKSGAQLCLSNYLLIYSLIQHNFHVCRWLKEGVRMCFVQSSVPSVELVQSFYLHHKKPCPRYWLIPFFPTWFLPRFPEQCKEHVRIYLICTAHQRIQHLSIFMLITLINVVLNYIGFNFEQGGTLIVNIQLRCLTRRLRQFLILHIGNGREQRCMYGL